MRKILGYIGVILGVLFLVAAGVVRWVVAPDKMQLPSDSDTTRNYAGTATTVLNAAALTGGAGSPLILHGVPITVAHRTKVLDTNGVNALVSDARQVSALGRPIASVDYRYAVNRKNFGPGTGYSNVVHQQGLTFNWPIGTHKQNYTGWVPETQRTTTLTYTGTGQRGGADVYTFTTVVKPVPLTDPQLLSQLPKSLPKAILGRIAAQLSLPPALLRGLQAVLPSLPSAVPLAYTYQLVGTYWVAPATGIIVDAREHQVTSLGLALPGLSAVATPVLDMTYQATPASLSAAAKDANNKANDITLIQTTLPLIALIVGIVLLVAGVILLVLSYRRRPAPGAPPATTGSPAGVPTPAAPRQ